MQLVIKITGPVHIVLVKRLFHEHVKHRCHIHRVLQSAGSESNWVGLGAVKRLRTVADCACKNGVGLTIVSAFASGMSAKRNWERN
jgi:hypothetical protein